MTSDITDLIPVTCFYCGEENLESTVHRHYALFIYENGKYIGRLTPEGTVARLTIYAWILGKGRAEQIASEINAAGNFTAKVRPF